ncbi:uncharacterized protein [Argopecten irradians]|uniref:uncharacterized protein isoform X2 n=1 Tax=Argopecten irradians TaxID=31199 RepID=UPI0037192159
MGCVCTKKEYDHTVQKPALNSYPRDPQYNNVPQNTGPAPLVNVPGGGPPLNSGEMFVAGAVVAGGGAGILPGPEMYNPMSGDFQAL